MNVNYLLRKLNLRAFRYCVLVTLLICHALVASIAVWNLDFTGGDDPHPSLLGIDCYLTFLGCSGLFVLFVVGFVELARKCWSIGTVWFECIWVSLWGLMYLVGAIGLTAIESLGDCTTSDRTPKCVSSQVLLAFTWLCTMTLIIYFSVFIFAVVINKKKDSTIWHSTMRKFPWAGTCDILASAPPTPTLSKFQNNVPIIHAPRPKHARLNDNQRSRIFSWRSGLSQEYQIEHYQPSAAARGPSQSVELPRAAAPPLVRAPALPPIEAEPAGNNFVSSLYPLYMQQAIIDSNPELDAQPDRSLPEAALTSTSASPAGRVVRSTPAQAILPPSPPPLGKWPRSDILSQPVSKVKRKPIPASYPGPGAVDTSQPSSSNRRESDVNLGGGGQLTGPSSFAPTRPIGPRKQSGSYDVTIRPPSTRFAKS